MGQTTIRVPDDLLEAIDETTDEETTRSEWIREACRERLDKDDLRDRVDQLDRRVTELEAEADKPLLTRLRQSISTYL